MSTEDAIGFVRPHDRIGEQVQRSALNADGVKGILTDRSAIERMACPGRVFKVRHLFLFAEPKTRRKPGGWRRDLLAFIGRVEDKGAVIKDVDMQLTSDKPSHRTGMLAAAFEQLANNGRTIHLAKRRQGRKKRVYPPEIEAKVEKVWMNRRDYPEEADAGAAIKKLCKSYTKERARREYGNRIKPKT